MQKMHGQANRKQEDNTPPIEEEPNEALIGLAAAAILLKPNVETALMNYLEGQNPDEIMRAKGFYKTLIMLNKLAQGAAQQNMYEQQLDPNQVPEYEQD